MLKEIKVKAPAKINLFLELTGRRDDGYHLINTIMQTVSIFDTVIVKITDNIGIKIFCDNPFIPCDKRNIVYKAAMAFSEYTGINVNGLEIYIDKVIPSQAGMAGGSADGAAVLVGLNKLYSANLTVNQLCEIGVKIGADVPFCINGGTVLCEGIGEVLTPLPAISECYFVIVKPSIGISTIEAYKKYDELENPGIISSVPMLNAINNSDITSISRNLYNRFETVSLSSQIEKVKDDLNKNGALNALMSGSGSSVFGIFTDEESAIKCINALSEKYEYVLLSTPVKNGPVII